MDAATRIDLPVVERGSSDEAMPVRVHRVGHWCAPPEHESAVGASPAWQRVVARALRVAPTDATVFLCGESGTGKEVVARLIHRRSPRADGPFIAINCAAL